MLEHKYSDIGVRCTTNGIFIWSSFKPVFAAMSAPLDDSDMFIFLEFRFGCLISPYEKYSDVCSSCSVYTFFVEVFTATPHPRVV